MTDALKLTVTTGQHAQQAFWDQETTFAQHQGRQTAQVRTSNASRAMSAWCSRSAFCTQERKENERSVGHQLNELKNGARHRDSRAGHSGPTPFAPVCHAALENP